MILPIPAKELDTYLAFLDEARDHLDSIEQRVLDLAHEADPAKVDILFRSLHSIKGVASFLGLADIQRLSHRLESVFDTVRQGGLAADDGLIRICLGNLDALKSMLENLAEALEARTRLPDGSFTADMRDVDYETGFCELEGLLSAPAAAKASGAPAPASGGPAPVSDPPKAPGEEEILITQEMRVSFQKESEELLEATEQLFLKLGGAPAGDPESLSQAFRNIHSFKGNCGFFGFGDLERVSHKLESVLEVARDGSGSASSEVIECALKCMDVFRTAVAGIAKGGSGSIADADRRAEILEALLASETARAAAGEATKVPLGEILIDRLDSTPADIDYALSLQKRPLGQILVDEGLATPAAVQAALEAQERAKAGSIPAAQAAPARPSGKKDLKRDLRVDLAKLDQLLDLVGELVISTGMIFNHPVIRQCEEADLEKISHQLKGVVSELQNVALGVRMIPVEDVFRKMTRLVHDLSGKSGKKVKLEFKGEETEIDKNVADLISDPMVHMIRNSVDHGLETPAERAAQGKDAAGSIVLEAGQEGGEVLITIRDDGRGLSREKILRKAREKRLVGEEGEALSDEQVFSFIFMPGFSTAEAVTATSGRGVGMDVVKSNIDRLNGRISIASRPGQGSAITLRIPLTLSIIDGMMVRIGASQYILPLVAVRETISPKGESIFRPAGEPEMLHLRGRSLPILRLDGFRGGGDHGESSPGLLVNLEAQGARYCLHVDELLGQRQVVVKALPPFLGKIPGVSSCSILDDGEISLILDVAALHETFAIASIA